MRNTAKVRNAKESRAPSNDGKPIPPQPPLRLVDNARLDFELLPNSIRL